MASAAAAAAAAVAVAANTAANSAASAGVALAYKHVHTRERSLSLFLSFTRSVTFHLFLKKPARPNAHKRTRVCAAVSRDTRARTVGGFE